MNALEATRRVDEPRVRIQAGSVPEGCEVIFADNGPGVSLAGQSSSRRGKPGGDGTASRVFDARFTTKEGHLGMGLTIARQMIESHGGTLDLLIDGRRKGASFRLVLPRKRSRATVHGRNGA